MKKIFKRAVMAAAVSATVFGTHAAYAQVATIDAAAIANMVQQLAAEAQQLAQLKAQFQVATQQYNAITGSSGLGGLISNQVTDLANEIPNTAKAYANANGSTAPSSSSDYGQMQSQMRNMGRTDAMKYAEYQRQQKAGIDRAQIQQALDRQTIELQNIQQLTAQIDQSTTQKQIDDLHARIAASQNTLTVEQNQINAMRAMQANRDKQDADARDYAAKRWALGDDGEEPSAPSILGN